MIVGTGVDITEVSRLRKAVEKWGEDFLKRIFTKRELENARKRSSFYQHLAGRFAAKEAIFKAMKIKDLGWQEVEILNDSQGSPVVRISNAKARDLEAQISISHVKTYAVASAFVAKKT